MTASKTDDDAPLSREQQEKDLDKWYAERREAGLLAHRAQEHHAALGLIEINTVGGRAFVKTKGGQEQELDQAGVFSLIKELQAAFQAVS
jgi:hypothetical protein